MSNRIHELHLKINALLENRNNWTAIDVDLLLDYTRVFYADLLEIKGELITSQKDFTESGSKKIESNVIDSNLINGSVQHIEMDDAQKSVSSSGSITLEMPPNSFKKELNNHESHSNVDVDLNKISVEEGEIYNAETSTIVEDNNNISQNSHKTNIEKKEVRKLIGINDK